MSAIRTSIIAAVALLAGVCHAEEDFANLVGSVAVGDVKQKAQIELPFILWGGEYPTFRANGNSLTTKQGSTFAKQGLSFKMVPGDDFVGQVKRYVAGETPFLRGTFRMIAQASGVIGADPRTQGVVVLQMTWSAGDHMVARAGIKTVADLKGKTVCLQTGGPHVGLVDDILKTAGLAWDDIKVLWVKDLTGTPESPAERFRAGTSVDACLVVTPDMIGLTGGLQNTGTGAEGTVDGARVLVSTAELSRSIADVYVVRKDWYDQNRELVTKFVAGYLKSCEEVIDLKKQYESKGSKDLTKLLEFAQKTWGRDAVPTIDEDAFGLLCDCTFVGHPGNVAFFTEENNLNGFAAFNRNSLDLAVGRGYASKRHDLLPSGLDYNSGAFIGYLTKTAVARAAKFNAEALVDEIEALSLDGALDENTVYSFTIEFAPNQMSFSDQQYGADFQKVVEMAAKYGNAAVAVRGHTDPTKTLANMVRAGLKKGTLKVVGSRSTGRKYYLQGKELDLNNTSSLVESIEAGLFDGVPEYNPRELMQAGLNLSRRRAEAVRDAVIKFAIGKGMQLDQSQIQPLGVGIKEPIVAKPTNRQEAKLNRRVEFRLVRVTPEAMNEADFDF